MLRNLITAVVLVLVGVLSGHSDPTSSVFDSGLGVDALLYQNRNMQQQIYNLDKRCNEIQAKAGPAGPAGPKGDTGAAGKDGVVDYDKVWEWIKAHPPEQPAAPTVDDIVKELPPITFERLGGDGNVLDSITVPLGGKARFPAMTVNYQNASGTVLDTKYVPVGGVLNLHIDVKQ